MAEMRAYPSGTPSWVDAVSPDLTTSTHFYKSLFGWETEDLGPKAGGYTLASSNGRLVAGLGRTMLDGEPASWRTYVNVDDVDATADIVRASGGAILFGPHEVLDLGRLAIISDPAGATCGLWEPRAHLGAEAVNEPGSFCWNELQTREPESAKAFYRTVFGWGEETSEFNGMRYIQWQRMGTSIAGMLPLAATAPADVPAFWLVYFGVEDCDDATRHAVEIGGETRVPVVDSPAGRFSVLADPCGATFALIGLPSPSA